jgi:spore maturation protein CgeB
MAPAIQGDWQCRQGYIPCRIFKNISYGQFGITNSKTVYELFGENIIYNSDTYQLFIDAKKYIQSASLEDLYKQMDFVRDNHTYINRINSLLTLATMVYKNKNNL